MSHLPPRRGLPLALLLIAACEPLGAVVPTGLPPDAAPIGPLGGAGGFVPGGDPDPPDAASPPPDAAAVDAAPAPDGNPFPCGGCAAGTACVAGTCKPKGEIVAPTLPACTSPPCLTVLNNCPVTLWTHAIGTVPIDDGNVRQLDPGQSFQYAALPFFGGGRLYAYYKEPDSKQDRTRLVSDYNQFVEMTVDRDGTGAIAQNYNVSYVDYLSLPVYMKATGAGCAETKCGARFSDWAQLLAQCPTDLLYPNGPLATCTGSYNYCVADGRDGSSAYCTKMQAAHGVPGSAAYGGVFPAHGAEDVTFWDGVAAWNRGTTPGNRDGASYYQTEPYNHYARWIHHELACDHVYAFSTDDHQEQAGFVRCVSPELQVIWCPYR